MPRFTIVLSLALVAVSAHAQADGPTSDRLAAAPVAYLPVSLDAPTEAASVMASDAPAPAAVDADGSLVATPVDELAPVEDPVQLRAPRAPVRMELAQTRRRVVLLPGVASREPVPAPDATLPIAAPDSSGAHVIYSRAVVVVGEGGRREVRYVERRAAALDLGADVGCGENALEIGLRLRGVRSTPLRRGMRGDAVKAAQQLLCVAGYETGLDGEFDAETDRAVRDFQRDHNAAGRGRRLTVDGAFGYRTRQAVEAAIAAAGR